MGINSKVHIAVDNKGKVINLKAMSRTTAGCPVTLNLIKTIKLGVLFGARADNANSIINYAE